jgi:hypothetical protein
VLAHSFASVRISPFERLLHRSVEDVPVASQRAQGPVLAERQASLRHPLVPHFAGCASSEAWRLRRRSVALLQPARGSARRGFFERVAERGARSSRSIVAALLASIFARIVSSSFTCPLRSKAGSKIGNKAFRRLPQTRSEASHNRIRAPRAALVVKRWMGACLAALRDRLTVQCTDRRLLVIAGAGNELVQNPTLLLACSRPIT